MYHFDLCLFCIIAAIINAVDNKKYDIEEESKNAYGMDLQNVLRQFRRSDDYVKILKMRTNEFNVFFGDVVYHSLDYHQGKMEEEIKTSFGLKKSPSDVPTTTFKTESTTVCIPGESGKKTCPPPEESSTIPASRQLLYEAKARILKSKLSGRRQAGAKAIEQSLLKVKHIDEYPQLGSQLTAEERNYYKSLAFEYAGETIHTTIRAFGAEPVDVHGSTQMNAEGTTSTQHMLRHIVSWGQENASDARINNK
ncbi:uncharacterized protein LOC134672972 isoform X2 [Cydia fagiglandana]|uniref:uncharacterized protein LOC134672972 isoform X2 n=1 Tax=Cydia fagiglandana TaxID=1458189 RepID=UPI002FEE5567